MDILDDLDWNDAAQGLTLWGRRHAFKSFAYWYATARGPSDHQHNQKGNGHRGKYAGLPHLNALRLAKLTRAEKSGRETMTRRNLPALEAQLVILDQCCVDTAKAEGPTG